MFELYAICVATAILVFFLFSKLSRHQESSRVQTYSRVSEIHNMLNPKTSTPAERLGARATSNDRLVRAFQLTNTFVSPSPAVHAAFVKRARGLLDGAAQRGWGHFRHVSVHAVLASAPMAALHFDTFVQGATLRVILVGLLAVDADIAELDSQDIDAVARSITYLWSLSKKPETIPPHLLIDLNNHLRRLIPNEDEFPNPLDFVIPAWETLWRVVAVAIAYAHRDPALRRVFQSFHNNPCLEQFSEHNQSDISAKSIITEVIRLHPPSKHISRALPSQVGPSGTSGARLEKAGIGAAQVSEVWGPSAHAFDPSRHHPSNLRPDQEETLLAFGFGPLKCIATNWAPMAAAVMAAAVLDWIETEGVLVTGDHIGDREGWESWVINARV